MTTEMLQYAAKYEAIFTTPKQLLMSIRVSISIDDERGATCEVVLLQP